MRLRQCRCSRILLLGSRSCAFPRMPDLIQRLQTEAAIAPVLAHLMRALPALARVTRYGDVRETDTSLVGDIVRGMLARICVGLPVAAGSLDDAAAETMRQDIRHAD